MTHVICVVLCMQDSYIRCQASALHQSHLLAHGALRKPFASANV